MRNYSLCGKCHSKSLAKKMTEKVLNLLLILGASALATPVEKSHWGPAEPSGPQGPPGAVFAFDLLSNSWGHIGAFQ